MREVKVANKPDALLEVLTNPAYLCVPAQAYEQRSLVLSPDVSMVSFDPEGREDYPA